MQLIDIDRFIQTRIILRGESLFIPDLEANQQRLTEQIAGKSMLVIGGAGTIGSSFTKAALHFKPAKLLVVDTNENALTELTRFLRSDPDIQVPEDYRSYPMDLGDAVFSKLLAAEGPFDIVANFAAHKHVRSEKDQYSIEAMLENNVFKAKRLLDQLTQQPPKHFFCVSTDKAANPVNVMGASKKLMEETIMAYRDVLPITTARFANVAFSNGSLLDGYLSRFAKRQAISCPSDVRRFFVSPEESGQICLLACILGQSGEVFFPKIDESQLTSFKDITESLFEEMGRPIKICQSEDEARQLSQNLSPDSPYPVYFFTSDTSGEKSFEEFYTATDKVDWQRFSSLGVIENAVAPSISVIESTLSDLREVMDKANYTKSDIVTALSQVIPNFAHTETGKNLDQKM